MKTITLDKEVSFEEGVKGLLSGEYYGIKPKDGSNHLIMNLGDKRFNVKDSLIWEGCLGGFVTISQYVGVWHPVIVDHQALNETAAWRSSDAKYTLPEEPARETKDEKLQQHQDPQQQAGRVTPRPNNSEATEKKSPEWNYNPIFDLVAYYHEIQSSAIKRSILSWLDENTKYRDKDYDRLYVSLRDEARTCRREQAIEEALAYIRSFCSGKYIGAERRTASIHVHVDSDIDHQLWEQGHSWLPEGLKLRLNEWSLKTMGTPGLGTADYHGLMNLLTQKCVGGFDIYVLLGDPFTNRVFHRVLVLMEKKGVEMQRLSEVAKEAVYLLANTRHELLQELSEKAYNRGDLFGTKALAQLKKSVHGYLEKIATASDAQPDREQPPESSTELPYQPGNQDDPHSAPSVLKTPSSDISPVLRPLTLRPITGFSFGGKPAPTLYGDVTGYKPYSSYPKFTV